MDVKEEFVRLLDRAIECAESVASSTDADARAWIVEDANTAKVQFARIKAQVLDGTLGKSGGAGLGISRALSEWAPKELLAAGRAVEDFFRTRWT